MIGKYRPLTDHLRAAAAGGRHLVEMTFDEIAGLVGGLPPSFTQRRWANTDHPQARAWAAANYRVEQVYLDRRRVRFTLAATTDIAAPTPAVPAGTPPPAATHADRAQAIPPVDVRVVLRWQDIGAVVLDSADLLSFPRLAAVPGLYRLTLPPATPGQRQRIYIGESSNMYRRLSGNYRSPGPSQQTSLRVNALLREHLRRGGSIRLATATTATAYLTGERQPLDLAVKAARLLAENAALVAILAAGDAEIVNLG